VLEYFAAAIGSGLAVQHVVSLFARQVSAIPCSRKKSEPFTGKVGETTGQMQMGMLHITVGLLPSEKQIHGIGLQSKQEIPRLVKDKDIYRYSHQVLP